MSRLTCVTITGADDSVDPKELAKLSKEFPFVEWAILLSANKQGNTPRYPSLRWLNTLSPLQVNRAVHICGGWARDILKGNYDILTGARLLVGQYNRIQLNISPYLLDKDKLDNLWGFGARAAATTIIQTGNPISDDWAKLIPSCERVRILDDKSGGRGTVGKFDTPRYWKTALPGLPVYYSERESGFAGGITPENVLEKLEEIEALDFKGKYWIDMESGIRVGNEFSIGKVEQVLRICRDFRKW